VLDKSPLKTNDINWTEHVGVGLCTTDGMGRHLSLGRWAEGRIMLKALGLQILMAACVLLASGAAGANDAETDKFIAQVISGARTNSARSAKLVEAAAALTDQPKIRLAILEKALFFGMKTPVTPAGCKAASAALDMLENEFPDKKDQWATKRAVICGMGYRCARTRSDKQEAGGKYLTALMAAAKIHEANSNWTQAATMYRQASPVDTYLKMGGSVDIRRKLKNASHMALVARRAVQYAASLKKDPSKASTRTALIKTLVVELDDPKAAMAHLNEDVDEFWRTYIPLAAKDLSELPEAQCLELAQWYSKELATKTSSSSGKSVSLRRARSYYQRFGELHTTGDMQAFRAKSALSEVEKQLAKLTAPPLVKVRKPTRRGGKLATLSLGNNVTVKLVRIPAGRFTMSSPISETGRRDHEGRQRIVTISKPFYMSVTEISQRQWSAVMSSTPWEGKDNAKTNPTHAASYISWNDASAFCGSLSKKCGKKVTLPTEAQWEYACRAGSRTAFCFGNDPSQLGNFAWFDLKPTDPKSYPHPVGQKRPNAWGLCDMHGNVYELCLDSYSKDAYAMSKSVDPVGPDAGGIHVVRGGSFKEISNWCRSSHRHMYKRLSRNAGVGFRIVLLSD
jgi:formylglycine-generating enzyme required for sulfatase activity